MKQVFILLAWCHSSVWIRVRIAHTRSVRTWHSWLCLHARCCVSERRIESGLCKVISNATTHKKWETVGGFQHGGGCCVALPVISHEWSTWQGGYSVYPGEKHDVKDMLTSPFRVKLHCRVFQTVGQHRTRSMKTFFSCFSRLCLLFMLKHMAPVSIHWVEIFPFLNLQNV